MRTVQYFLAQEAKIVNLKIKYINEPVKVMKTLEDLHIRYEDLDGMVDKSKVIEEHTLLYLCFLIKSN